MAFSARPFQSSTTDEQFVPEIEGNSTNSKAEGSCQIKIAVLPKKIFSREIKGTFPVSNRYRIK